MIGGDEIADHDGRRWQRSGDPLPRSQGAARSMQGPRQSRFTRLADTYLRIHLPGLWRRRVGRSLWKARLRDGIEGLSTDGLLFPGLLPGTQLPGTAEPGPYDSRSGVGEMRNVPSASMPSRTVRSRTEGRTSKISPEACGLLTPHSDYRTVSGRHVLARPRRGPVDSPWQGTRCSNRTGQANLASYVSVPASRDSRCALSPRSHPSGEC